jgi:hypothetical protein
VTITLFLSKWSLETRLLTVSLVSAIISGDMGKNCDSAMVSVAPDCCHPGRIKNSSSGAFMDFPLRKTETDYMHHGVME